MKVDLFGFDFDVARGVRSLLYIAFVLLAYFMLRRILKEIFRKSRKSQRMTEGQESRLQTIHEVLLSVAKYVALILILLAILANFGVNVTSLLAGLGIMTAVMGLAFQDLIKDVIAGATILVEGQFNVGDQIMVDGFKGQVISMGLKTTQVQGYTGEVKIIANHNIGSLVNYSKSDILAQVAVGVPYSVPPEKVMSALSSVKRAFSGARAIPEMRGEIAVGPITDIEGVGVDYLISCPCGTADCTTVQGALMEKIVEVFQKKQIPIATPQVEVRE